MRGVNHTNEQKVSRFNRDKLNYFPKGLINNLHVSDAHVNIRPWNPTRATVKN